MARAVIIASFLDYPIEIARQLREEDYIICLDGGYDIALQQGIKPQLLLGDFDSIKSDIPKDKDIEIRQFPPEKDYTDLELIFRILDPDVYDELLIIGGLGGRLDQTITNIQMLDTYTAKETPETEESCKGFGRIDIVDGRNHCFLIRGKEGRIHEIPRRDDAFLSLFALSEECEGIHISGVKYPLDNATLKRGVSLGVSNEFRAEKAVLSFKKGSMLVVIAGNH